MKNKNETKRVKKDMRSPEAKARDSFLLSDEGIRLCDATTLGVAGPQWKFLTFRITVAFKAGMEACARLHKITP